MRQAAIITAIVLLAAIVWARPPYYRGTLPRYPNPSLEPRHPFPFLRGSNCNDICTNCHTH